MSNKDTHVDIYPMETLSSMVVVKRRENEPEYQHESKSNRDEVELAHFGKRQQLKVSKSTDQPTPSSTTPLADLSFFCPEDLRSRLHDRPDLHLDGHLGRDINVSSPLYLYPELGPPSRG